MGTRSPWSVGGGVLEFGFWSRRVLFSGPGSLEEWSCSAFCVLAFSWALALNPASAAAANAAEPIPRTLLRENPSCTPLSFFSSFIALSSFAEFDGKCPLPYEDERSTHSSTPLTIRNYWQVNRFVGFGVTLWMTPPVA